MDLLKQKIRENGVFIGTDIVKVDMFLNHQIDIRLLEEMGKEFKRLFDGEKITKILTVEVSGIAIACMAAKEFDVPVVFAKKTEAKNLSSNTYCSEVYSFTKDKVYKIRVAKEYLDENDRILIIDDFLANGKAIMGLLDIANQAGAEVAGIGIAIEKGFQPGGKEIRDMGINLKSLAIIDSVENGQAIFRS